MVSSLQWEVKPLQQVAPFAVKLEKPELLLQQIRQRLVPHATPRHRPKRQAASAFARGAPGLRSADARPFWREQEARPKADAGQDGEVRQIVRAAEMTP